MPFNTVVAGDFDLPGSSRFSEECGVVIYVISTPDGIASALRKAMNQAGNVADLGLVACLWLTLNNGLVVCLSGKPSTTVVLARDARGRTGVRLAVITISDGFTSGAVEAPLVVNVLQRPISRPIWPTHNLKVKSMHRRRLR